MKDLPFRLRSWVKRRCWRRMPVAVVQKRGADGEYVRVHFVRRQTLHPSEDGPELLAPNRLFYVFVYRAAVDDLMYRDNPPSFFLKIANPSCLLVKTHEHSPSRSFVHIGHDSLVRHRRLLWAGSDRLLGRSMLLRSFDHDVVVHCHVIINEYTWVHMHRPTQYYEVESGIIYNSRKLIYIILNYTIRAFIGNKFTATSLQYLIVYETR